MTMLEAPDPKNVTLEQIEAVMLLIKQTTDKLMEKLQEGNSPVLSEQVTWVAQSFQTMAGILMSNSPADADELRAVSEDHYTELRNKIEAQEILDAAESNKH